MRNILFVLTAAIAAVSAAVGARQSAERPFMTSQLVFPPEHWHNHASMVVELPGGDLFVCWFHGSGECTGDDVVVRGARLRKGSKSGARRSCSPTLPGIQTRTPRFSSTGRSLSG